MLDHLPQELLEIVVGLLPEHDRQTISLVSRRLYANTLHLAYRKLSFSAHSEWALNVLNIRQFVEARSEHKRVEQHLGYVQDLHFSAPFRVARFRRCSYRTAFWYDQGTSAKQDTDHNMFHADFLCDVLNQIRIIFDDLKMQSLRSFRWHMGTCLPAHILDEDGYLTTCQSDLQNISLRIDAGCPHTGLRLGGLMSMLSLQSFSWESISTMEELGLLQRCLEKNAHHLRILELVFTRLANIGSKTFMATIGTFSSLRVLSLARFPFNIDTHSAFYLILPHLKSLTLWDCPGQITVLGTISLLNVPIRLTNFEISFEEAYEPQDYARPHPLVGFLTSFGTLVQLHVLASNVLNEEEHLRTVESHPFLKQFVYHTRNLQSADRVLPEETQYIHPTLYEPVRNVLSRSSIQNVGLCIHPFMARAILEPIASKLHVEVLHLRLGSYEHLLCDFLQTVGPEIEYSKGNVDSPSFDYMSCGSESDQEDVAMADGVQTPHFHECPVMDLVGFADWAFGPRGIKSLKALAYGDFSCDDRYSRQQVLFVRDGLYSAVSNDRPYGISNLKKAPVEVQQTVAACPLEYLMDSNESWQP